MLLPQKAKRTEPEASAPPPPPPPTPLQPATTPPPAKAPAAIRRVRRLRSRIVVLPSLEVKVAVIGRNQPCRMPDCLSMTHVLLLFVYEGEDLKRSDRRGRDDYL